MKQIFLTLIAILAPLLSYAQNGDGNRIDLSINQIEQKVDQIENDICYKTLVDWSGYRLGDEKTITEWLAVLYFDKNHRIRKSKLLFSFPEEDGFYHRYFDETGVAIHALHATFSGMNYSNSIARYLNADKTLVYIDFLRRDLDAGGITVEHTCRSGGYNLPMPQIDGTAYDKVLDLNSLANEINRIFGIDSLYTPQKLDSVQFKNAKKGDTSYITNNSIPLYNDTLDYKLITNLNVGHDVNILDVNNKWCKIKYRTWKQGQLIQTIGYVEYRFLAPIEISILE